MKQFALLFFTLFCMLLTPTLNAQETEDSGDGAPEGATPPEDADQDDNITDKPIKMKVWEASLPGGEFVVSLRNISSISMHSYLISNTTYMVHEVVIDTRGNTTARFYALESITKKISQPINLNKSLSDTSKYHNLDINTLVEKTHPHTTHAKTIEYRLADKSELSKLLESAKKSWLEHAGRKFAIQ